MSADIFISHSSEDRQIAETLREALENCGFHCWISSRDIAPGENFQVAIVQAIRAAKVMVLVFSANSNNSEEIKKEVVLAGQNRLIVIPVRLEDVVPDDAFAYELSTRQWIDMFEDWEHAIQRLVRQLTGIAGVKRLSPAEEAVGADERSPLPAWLSAPDGRAAGHVGSDTAPARRERPADSGDVREKMVGTEPAPDRRSVDQALPRRAALAPAAAAPATPGDRALIIDDDAAIRKTVAFVAREAGFAVEATDDEATIAKLIDGWQPTAIFLDLQMPGRDGVQLLSDLAAAGVRAPVILTTGSDTRTCDAALRLGRERGLQMGECLQKPFDVRRLRKLLGQLRGQPGPSPQELRDALAADQMFLEYQPKLACRTGRIVGAEALIRWQHPTCGRLEPDAFMRLAEENALLPQLTDWVVATAVGQAASWRAASLPLDVAVNVAAGNLGDPQFPDQLARHCAEQDVDVRTVTLEVSESSAMQDPLRALEVLTRLRVKGFRLSMDDFGTAASPLVQLQRMPFSELKVDRSFVTGMTRDHGCRVIAGAIIGLARNLGLQSVAEGVEDEETWEALRDMDCDLVQGHHFSRPLSPDRLARLAMAGQGAGSALSQSPKL